jgi:hypothetical protein
VDSLRHTYYFPAGLPDARASSMIKLLYIALHPEIWSRKKLPSLPFTRLLVREEVGLLFVATFEIY